MEIIILAFSSYIVGSIPFGLILTKLFLKKDVREIGSGNIGATNVLRTGNKALAFLTLVFDIGKGYLVVKYTSVYFTDLVYLMGLICFIAHIFPVWLKFKGGKGVAVYVGIILALSLKLGLVFCVTWILIAFVSKYSSLSSMVSALIIFLFSIPESNFELNSYLFVTFLIILYSHKSNIIRLKNKTEDKIKL